MRKVLNSWRGFISLVFLRSHLLSFFAVVDYFIVLQFVEKNLDILHLNPLLLLLFFHSVNDGNVN